MNIKVDVLDEFAHSVSTTGLLGSQAEDLIETSSEGFFALDGNWRFVYVNREAENILGKPRVQLLGKSIWEIYPETVGTAFEANYYQAIEQQQEQQFEARSVWNDLWLVMRVVPSVTGLAIYCRDISTVHLTQLALDRLLTSSICLLWYSTVKEIGPDDIEWDTRVAHEDAAQQYLPLDTTTFEHYALAWYLCRPEEDRNRIDRIAKQAVISGAPGYNQEYRCLRQDGEVRWLKEEAQIQNLGPGLWQVIGVCVDITEQKRTQEQLAEKEALLRSLFDSSPVHMGVVELLEDDVLHISDNRSMARFFGTTPEAIRFKRASQIGASPTEIAKMIRRYREAQITGQPVHFEDEFKARWFSFTICWLGISNEGRPRFSYQATDITERKLYERNLQAANEWLAEANSQLTALATTDGLTGLKNHRAFHEILSSEFARVHRKPYELSLLLFDVDKFKGYNDSFGHPAGDQVLKTIADLVTALVRKSDVVARYGGEEFAMILPATSMAQSMEIANRVCETIAEYRWSRRQVTVSIGVSTCVPSAATASRLVEEADAALYMAKALGRNCVAHHKIVQAEYNARALTWDI